MRIASSSNHLELSPRSRLVSAMHVRPPLAVLGRFPAFLDVAEAAEIQKFFTKSEFES